MIGNNILFHPLKKVFTNQNVCIIMYLTKQQEDKNMIKNIEQYVEKAQSTVGEKFYIRYM